MRFWTDEIERRRYAKWKRAYPASTRAVEELADHLEQRWFEEYRRRFPDHPEASVNAQQACCVTIIFGQRYIRIDRGNEPRTGVFIIDSSDNFIYTVSEYGRPNRRHRLGQLARWRTIFDRVGVGKLVTR